MEHLKKKKKKGQIVAKILSSRDDFQTGLYFDISMELYCLAK